MPVLILGAGASIAAGYPRAEELFQTLERDAQHTGNLNFREAWELWAEVLAKSPTEIRSLLTAPNPEIALSLLDLCDMFISENFKEVFPGDKGQEAAAQSLHQDRLDPGLFKEPGDVWLHSASIAKNRLIFLLGEYFT
jgi:hypothetical protein